MITDRANSRDAEPAAGRPEWASRPERGTTAMLRVITFISLRFGRRAGRIVVYGIAAYFFLFAPTARTHMREYLRRALGRNPTPLDRYRLILAFASTIHDRLYLISERFDLFDISLEGVAVVATRFQRGEGTFLMGAHLGSFEVTRAIGRRQPGLRVAMAMYQDNARKLNAMLAAVNPNLSVDIIPLGTMDSMLQIRSRLDAGAFVGVLGDRTIGPERFERVPFLGAPACFPTSAMRAAAMLRRPVIFMTGLYRGANRYHVVFEELADFSTTTVSERDAAVRAAIQRYAAVLERYCASDPFNWFNFFDFWQEPAPPAGTGST
jgi:predicted LPLAT superfamily acyltransferase